MVQLPGNVCLGPLDLDRESFLNVQAFIKALSSVQRGEELDLLPSLFNYLVMLHTTFTVAERATIVSLIIEILSSGIGTFPVSLVKGLLQMLATVCSPEPPLPITIPWRVILDCIEMYVFSSSVVAGISDLDNTFFQDTSQALLAISPYYDPHDYPEIYARVREYLEDVSTPANLFKYLTLTGYWMPILPTMCLKETYCTASATASALSNDELLARTRSLLPGTYIAPSVLPLIHTDLLFAKEMESLHTATFKDLAGLLVVAPGKELSYLVFLTINRLLKSCPHIDIGDELMGLCYNLRSMSARTVSQLERAVIYFHTPGDNEDSCYLPLPEWFSIIHSSPIDTFSARTSMHTRRPSFIYQLLQAEACRSRYLYLLGLQQDVQPLHTALTEEYLDASPAFAALSYIVNAAMLGLIPKQPVVDDISSFLAEVRFALVVPDQSRQGNLQERIVSFIKAPLEYVLQLPITTTGLNALQKFGAPLVRMLLLQTYVERSSQDICDFLVDALASALDLFSCDTWPVVTQMAHELARIDATKQRSHKGLPSLFCAISEQLVARWFIQRNTAGITLPEAIHMCFPYLSIQHVAPANAFLRFLESIFTAIPGLSKDELSRDIHEHTADVHGDFRSLLFGLLDILADFVIYISAETLKNRELVTVPNELQFLTALFQKESTSASSDDEANDTLDTSFYDKPFPFGLATETNKFSVHLALIERVAVSLFAALDVDAACEAMEQIIMPFLFDRAIPERIRPADSFLAACVAGLESHCVDNVAAEEVVLPLLKKLYRELDVQIQGWLDSPSQRKTSCTALTCLRAVVSVDHLLVSQRDGARLDALCRCLLDYFASEEYTEYCAVSGKAARTQRPGEEATVESCTGQAEEELLPVKKRFAYIMTLAHSLGTPCTRGIVIYWRPAFDESMREAMWQLPTEASIAVYQRVIDACFNALEICIRFEGDMCIAQALLKLLLPYVQADTTHQAVPIKLQSYRLNALLDCLDITETAISPFPCENAPLDNILTVTDFNDATPPAVPLQEPRFNMVYAFSGCSAGMMQESMRLLSEQSPDDGLVRVLFLPTPQIANKRQPPTYASRRITVDAPGIFEALRHIVHTSISDGSFVGKKAREFLAIFSLAGFNYTTYFRSKPLFLLLSSIRTMKRRPCVARPQIETNFVSQLSYQCRIFLKANKVRKTIHPATLQFVPLMMELYIFNSAEDSSDVLSVVSSLATVAPAHYGAVHHLMCDIVEGLLRTPLDSQTAFLALERRFREQFGKGAEDILDEKTVSTLMNDSKAFSVLASKKYVERLLSFFAAKTPVECITAGLIGGLTVETLFKRYLAISVLLSNYDHEDVDSLFDHLIKYVNSIEPASLTALPDAIHALQARVAQGQQTDRVAPIESFRSMLSLDRRWSPPHTITSPDNIVALAAPVHKAIEDACHNFSASSWYYLCYLLMHHTMHFTMLPVPLPVLKQILSLLGENHVVYTTSFILFYSNVLFSYSYREDGTMQHPLTARSMPVVRYRKTTRSRVEKVLPSAELHRFLVSDESKQYLKKLLDLTAFVCYMWCAENKNLAKAALAQEEKTIIWRQMFILGGLDTIKTTLGLIIDYVEALKGHDRTEGDGSRPSGYMEIYHHQMLCNILWRMFEALPYLRSLTPSLYSAKIRQVMRKIADVLVMVQEHSRSIDVKTYWIALLVRSMENGSSEEMRDLLGEELAWFTRYMDKHAEYGDANKVSSRLLMLVSLISGALFYDAQLAEETALHILRMISAHLPKPLNFSKLILPTIAQIVALCIVSIRGRIVIPTLASSTQSPGYAGFFNVSTGSATKRVASTGGEEGLKWVGDIFAYLREQVVEWIATEPNSRSVPTVRDVIYCHEATLLTYILREISAMQKMDATPVLSQYELLRPIISLRMLDMCDKDMNKCVFLVARRYIDSAIVGQLCSSDGTALADAPICAEFWSLLQSGALHPKEYAFVLQQYTYIVTRILLTRAHLLNDTATKLKTVERYLSESLIEAMGRHNIIREQGSSAFMFLTSAMDRAVFAESYNLILRLFAEHNVRQRHGLLHLIILHTQLLILNVGAELPRYLLNIRRLTQSKHPVLKQMTTQFYESFWKKYTEYEGIFALTFTNSEDLKLLQDTKTATSYVN